MRILLTIFFVISCAVSFAQDASSMKNAYLTADWVSPEAFTYSVETSQGREYYIVEAKSWKARKMFETAEFVGKLNRLSEYKSDTVGFRLPNTRFDKKNPDIFTFSYKKGHFQYNIRTKELTAAEPLPGRQFRKQSSTWYRSYTNDSLHYVLTKGHDLWLYDVEKGDSTCLTGDGERWNSYSLGGKNEIASGKTGSAIGRWVGKSHKRLMIKEDWRSVGTLTIVNSLATPRPTAETYKYPMPGDTGVVRYNVMLADADS